MDMEEWGDTEFGISDDTKTAISEGRAPPRLKTAGHPAFHADQKFYRLVVTFLGIVLVSCVVGILVLSYLEKRVPEGIIALGSAALGALASVLTPSR